MNYVLTAQSLESCIRNAPSADWFSSFQAPEDGAWDVLTLEAGGVRHVIHRDDDNDTPRIVIITHAGSPPFANTPVEAWRSVAERIHWAALSAARPPLRLPELWSEYHDGNLLAFFAHNRSYGPNRWVVELNPAATRDLVFWRVTTDDAPISLSDFQPDRAAYTDSTRYWDEAVSTARGLFAAIPPPPTAESIQDSIELADVTFGAVTRYRTYAEWQDELTPQQRAFLELRADHSVKLKGPAGSGKTLALELKLLQEVYASRAKDPPLRVLFATHSWAIAEQVDSALTQLDATGTLRGIEIYPLLQIARDKMPAERSGRGVALLGEDSLSGRRKQLEMIDSIVERLSKGDWLAYRDSVSTDFRARLESPHGSPERNALIWDLMNEFGSVLSAQGIFPGITAERRYLSVVRAPWMMPLQNDDEVRFVLAAYTAYIEELRAMNVLTADQLVNDFLNYLETFQWHLRREHDGYDLIFVDELHLFTDQERLVLHYLSRDPDAYPVLFMALDPRQSPSEAFVEFSANSASLRAGHAPDDELAGAAEFELTTVHRFTPEILQLVQHIHRSYPALDLGQDWEVDIEALKSSAESGEIPSLYRRQTAADEVQGVVERAIQLKATMGRDRRLAVIVLNSLLLPEFQAVAADQGDQFCVIAGRDDVERLRYRSQSIVLGGAEYLAGLQFDTAIVAGLPEAPRKEANVGHRMRRFLALFYLAVSRASRRVEINICEARGGVPEMLEDAVKKGILVET